MSANLSNSDVLSRDVGFQGRVRSSMIGYAVVILTEAETVSNHEMRIRLALKVLMDVDAYLRMFMALVCDNPSISIKNTGPQVLDSDIQFVVESSWDFVSKSMIKAIL